MNTHLPHDDDDGRLPGEDELGALYRRLPRKEPGPALDAAVLRAAAAAVRGGEPAAATARPLRRARWPIALGSAAVLVLAAGLGWRMRDMPASTPPAQAGAVTVQEAARPAAPAVAAAPAATNQVQGHVADAASPPAAQAAERMAIARARQADATMAKRAAPAASIAQNAPLREPAAEAAAPMAAAPVAADQAAPAAAAEVRSFAPKQAQRPPAGHPADMPRAEARTAEAPAAAGRAAAAASGMPAAPAMAPAPAPPAADTARDPHDTPVQELDKIRRLLAADRRDEARQRLADFHRDRPDYPLPDDLRVQLLTP